jgi:hypothetical protein
MSEDLKARLAAAKAARAELAAQNEVSEEDALTEEIAHEEQKLADETALTALRVQYGTKALAQIQTDEGLLVLHRADPIKFKRFCEKTDVKVDDIEALVLPCVKHPALPVVQQLFKDYPGLITRCGEVVAHLAGVRKDDLAKK